MSGLRARQRVRQSAKPATISSSGARETYDVAELDTSPVQGSGPSSARDQSTLSSGSLGRAGLKRATR